MILAKGAWGLKIAPVGLNPISTAIAGMLIKLNVQLLFVGAGSLLVAAVLVSFFNPSIRNLGIEHHVVDVNNSEALGLNNSADSKFSFCQGVNMNTEAAFEQPKVGVVLMKEGSCQGWLKPTVDGIRAMLYEISAEVGVPIVVRDITAQEAINGAMPPQIVAEGWQYYYRMDSGIVPIIIINGKIVSVGPRPDRNSLKAILLNASPIKA